MRSALISRPSSPKNNMVGGPKQSKVVQQLLVEGSFDVTSACSNWKRPS
jgi:hypothetical protein